MSCNGCRVLRKGCSENCVLRSCLHWIGSSEAQANATLFLAKFFGRSDLMSLISAVPEPQRPALFQSLLFEACGRTVNPVNGAVGLLWSGNWQVCQAAVETVLSGGTIQPSPGITVAGASAHDDFPAEEAQTKYWSQSMPNQSQVSDLLRLSLAPNLAARSRDGRGKAGRDRDAMSFYSEESAVTTTRSFGAGHGGNEKKLLNLFV